jgi:hypothetical protein
MCKYMIAHLAIIQIRQWRSPGSHGPRSIGVWFIGLAPGGAACSYGFTACNKFYHECQLRQPRRTSLGALAVGRERGSQPVPGRPAFPTRRSRPTSGTWPWKKSQVSLWAVGETISGAGASLGVVHQQRLLTAFEPACFSCGNDCPLP